jgi:hypothetical protein
VLILRQIGNRLYLEQRLVELGQLALASGRLDKAEAALQEVLNRAVSASQVYVALEVLLLLAELRRKQSQWLAALRLAAFVAGNESATADMRETAETCLQSLVVQYTADEVTAVRTQVAALSLTDITIESQNN